MKTPSTTTAGEDGGGVEMTESDLLQGPAEERAVAARDSRELPSYDLGRVAGGAALGTFGKIFRYAVNYLFLIAAARLLDLRDLEGYLLALAVVMVTVQASLVGLDRGVVKYVALYASRGEMESVTGTVRLTLGAGIALALVAAVVVLAGAWGLPAGGERSAVAVDLLAMMVWTVPLQAAMQLALAASRGLGIMRFTTIAEDSLLPVTNLAVFLLLALVARLPAAPALAYLAATAAAAFAAATFLSARVPLLDRSVSASYPARPLFKTSLPLAVTALSGHLYTWLGVLILGYTGGAGEVAVYQVSLRTTFLLVLFAMPLNQMAAPAMSSLSGKTDRGQVREVFRTVTRWTVTASAPAVVGMVLFAGDWLGVFGSEFRRGAACMAVLALATFFNAFGGPCSWLLQMSGQHRAAMWSTVGFVVCQFCLVLWFSARYGALGAAIGMAVATLALVVSLIVWTHRALGLQPFHRALAKPLAAAAASAAAGVVVRAALAGLQGGLVYLRLGLGAMVVLVVYAVALLTLGIEPEDRALWSRAISRIAQMAARWRARA